VANVVTIDDARGDVVDANYYCSDECAKSDENYAGWYGCVELDFGQKCHAVWCDNQIHGVEQCNCEDAGCVGWQKTD
jgi:hypothetical protein